MKRFLAGIVAPLGALGFGAMTVYASSGAATPFKVQYPGTPGSAWTCAGAHVANKVSIQDSESCLITGGHLALRSRHVHQRPGLPCECEPSSPSSHSRNHRMWPVRTVHHACGTRFLDLGLQRQHCHQLEDRDEKQR
jgi:hypothetical protein